MKMCSYSNAFRYIVLIIYVMCCLLPCSAQPTIHVTNLRCELLSEPQGIDNAIPRLSWEITGEERNIQQRSYHILVASSLEKLNINEGDLWDSKKTVSNASVFVPYIGKKLESRMKCFWKVKVTTNKGTSSWSAPASWTMALMNPSDWQARWIGLDKIFKDEVFDISESRTRLSARYFRKEFEASQKPVKATAYVSGLGLYELYINGKKTGNWELAPVFTDYTKIVNYNTFDVTEALNAGKNTIGVILGNGRYLAMRFRQRQYGFPKMIFQLELEYLDGSKQTVCSDNTWKVTPDGPIRANNEYDGEEYNALKEMPGWNDAGFNDQSWMQAESVEAPGGKLEAQLVRSAKVMETLQPIAITQPVTGLYVLDMGQNMTGRIRMKVKGKAGDVVKLRFAEKLKPDGTLYMEAARSALVTDVYTLKGGGTEVWEPVFTYRGFRFVEVTGYPETPTINDFEGKVIYNEMSTTGQFETSNELINQIYKSSYWGICGNFQVGIPSDGPYRDERHGWLGDHPVVAHSESFIFDMNNMFAKWLDDIEQAQREDGSLSDVVPLAVPAGHYRDDITWPSTYLIIADMLYRQYGNDEPIRKHYESMKKWINYMHEKYMVDNIMPKDQYGDWVMPPESPTLVHSKDSTRITAAPVLGTTYYYRMLYYLEHFANILGKPDDAKTFAEEALAVKNAYNDKFFDKTTAQYDNNTVTANILSLYFGMAPEGYENKVLQSIIDKTNGEHKGHISTGMVGVQWLMCGLSDYGGIDLAFKLATNRGYPSWGYMIENGATTIWELWNGDTADPVMNAHNHVMLIGDLIVWFYEYLAGIKNAPGYAGYEKIAMRPYPVAGLDEVKASYQSVRGLIGSSWKKISNDFQWKITIPGNTSATIYIPATNKTQITESGKRVSSAKGVKFVKMESEYAVYEIGSGNYNFHSFK